MDFIERVFGIAPDRGSGSFELLLFTIPLLALGVVALRRRRREASRGDARRNETAGR
jgi:hypothetical protein